MYVVVYLLYMKIPKSVFHVTMRRKKMNLTAIISMEFAASKVQHQLRKPLHL